MSTATALSARAATRELDRRGLGALSFGHLGADLCQGAVPALIPFLVRDRGLDYASASVLVLVMTATSSLLQPLFGQFADRVLLPWMAPIALLVAGGGLALTVLSHDYGAMIAFIALSGIGISAFHPEAARRANHAAGARRATGMSYFSAGGNAGFALAPAIITPLVLAFGIRGAAFAAIVPTAAALVLSATMPHLLKLEAHGAAHRCNQAAGGDLWGPFSRVAGAAASRSSVYFGLQTFLSSFLIASHHFSAGAANAALTVLLVSAALGTLVGGRLADRIGRVPVLIGGMAALAPLVLSLLIGNTLLAYVFAAFVGFFYGISFSGTVVLGQEYLPNRLGVASAITLGAAMGVGGLAAALLGPLADSVGLTTVIIVIAALPLPGLGLALSLRHVHPAAGA